MNLLDYDVTQRALSYVRGWVARNSLDPVKPVLTAEMFDRDFARDLETCFPAVQYELLDHLDMATLIQGDLFFDSSITNDRKWRKIYLKWYKEPSKTARLNFPITTGYLDRHPEIQLAMVSILEPGGIIHPHTGPWNGCIRVHVGLKTPNSPDCFIDVAGQRLTYDDGGFHALDDTYPHHVVNMTTSSRVILFLDVERTMKTRYSQAVVRGFNRTIGRMTSRE